MNSLKRWWFISVIFSCLASQLAFSESSLHGLKNSEITLGQLTQQISTLNQQVVKEQQTLAALNTQEQVATNNLAKQREALSQQLMLYYQFRKSTALQLLLNQKNPETVSRHLQYYRYLNQARMELIQNIKQTVATLNEKMRFHVEIPREIMS